MDLMMYIKLRLVIKFSLSVDSVCEKLLFFCRSDMVVMPHTGVQDLAGAFKHSCIEPLMKTMNPLPAFLFAGP